MNDRKFTFIICANNDLYFNECTNYIRRLIVPEGYETEILEIRDAVSMTSGYNEAMNASDAKYKIYLHQDVFIVYPFFLDAILKIFDSDEKIGMIGVAGAPRLPDDFVMWHTDRVGITYTDDKLSESDAVELRTKKFEISDGLSEVEAIDGLIMITSADIPWREDILDGWDFYDVSQTFEMKNRGYKTIVPEQHFPWCLHDSGILNFRNYDHYRKICIDTYKSGKKES